MQPIDFRNENFAQIRSRLSAQREAVHRAWLAHGPGTTREIAAKSGMDILSFRPRTTELFQLGLVVEISGNIEQPTSNPEHRNEGTYRGRFLDEWQTWCGEQREALLVGQMRLI